MPRLRRTPAALKGGRLKLLRHHSVAIVLLALLLTLPAILSPPMTHDSFWINWVWADQFTSELAKGNFYPRWLSRSHAGLGSPVFYYYPPLTFYVTGLFGVAGLSTYGSIIAAFFLGFVASGFAMHAGLKDSAKAPLLGALLFMAAPYHVLDFYVRGALAEFLAISLIPLIALGLRRAVIGNFLFAAIVYAMLILTHLPLALLVSLFFIAPYGLYLARKTPNRPLLKIAVPLLLGLAISAIYLVPALFLESYRDTAALWEHAVLDPENWSVLSWRVPGPSPRMRAAVVLVLLVLAYASTVLILSRQRVWGGYAAVCCVMAAGLIPGFWALPLLESVQFPFRLLPLAEFAIAMGIAHLGLARLQAFAATLTMLAVSALFLVAGPSRPDVKLDQLVESHPDVAENLPPGGHPRSWPSQWALEISEAHPAPRQIGDRTVEPVFYFPAWEVRCRGVPVPTWPDPETKLLTYRGSACERRLRLTAPEQIGAVLTLGGIVLLFGLVGLRKRRPRASDLNGGPNP